MPPHKQKVQPRPSPLDEPPTASSSSSGSEGENHQHPSSPPLHHEEEASSVDEEEAASEASEEEEEDSEDLTGPVSKNPLSNPHHQSSSSESGSDTESESEPDSTPVEVKPLPSKPKPQPSPAPSKSSTKRPAENSNNADPKRAKKATDSSATATSSAPPSDEEGKKSSDQLKKLPRVWTEEEEVALVKGVSDFTKKTGQDPLKPTNFTAFYNFVKKSMHGEPSLTQVKDKVRRLKKKYETLATKGDPPIFVKPQDEKLFELAKKVWGAAAHLSVGSPSGSLDKSKSNGSAVNTSKKKETVNTSMLSANKFKPELVLAVVPDASPDKMQIDQKPNGYDAILFLRELARFKEGVSVGNLDEDDVKRGLELIGESKRAELSGRWKKLQRAEMKLLANRLELIGEQTKLILEALRSSNH